ncbi:MAG: ATP-binding cassette domain-containing protein [Muribaculaceae bacterium]|nr:ATP-binding cassette domain-containing protein [Muribaculaceae bacterium]
MKTPQRLILRDMLPLAFAAEPQKHSASEIWLREVMEFLPGQRYIIRSESGGGKSSLCSYLHGNRDDYSGSLTIGDKDARRLSVREWTELRRSVIAYQPQDMGLFPTLTAMENIILKNRLTSHKTRDEIMEMLDIAGVASLADRPAGKLSIGQQQRVALVRTLCQPFGILLLDEPVSHLDQRANLAVSQLIDREASAKNATVIATSVGNDLQLDGCLRLSL